MKYLEYEISSGRILSVVTTSIEPEAENGRGYYEIGRNEELDITQYAVRGGSLVKVGETNQEKLERERIRREHGEQCRRRLRSLKEEFVIALIAEDEDEMKNLRREFHLMEAYL
ncbi:MAG: hypothetical protein IJG51_11820 [Synergistaceae bacterium]|nr:hypothetical protein [Synergistaceae bacterium]MBQ6665882.1 hypothetical protein [Synergistaceae bacterium]